MKSYFQEAARTAARAFDFRGRATRGEFVTYLVLSQAPFVILALVLAGASSLTGPNSALSGTVIDAAMLGVLVLVTLPLGALCIRRFHDFGRSGWWSAPFLVLVCRTLLLDFIGIAAGWSVRGTIEAVLSYVDWLLILPAVVAFTAMVGWPSKSISETTGAEGSAPVV